MENKGSYRWYWAHKALEPCVTCGKPFRGTDSLKFDESKVDKAIVWSQTEGEHLECHTKRTGDTPVSGYKKTASK